MKKFWKNLCVCSMAVVSSLSLWACGKPAPEVSVDLDGDGSIAVWETIFESKEDAIRDLNSSVTIVEISDLAGLKAINENTTESKVYKLIDDINCNGEAISINLGSSTLLGNNKVIKNFKLGDCLYKETAEDEQYLPANIKGLFYNGVAIYDLRVFVGNQTIDINNTNSQTIISPFINVANMENIEVRGMLKVDRKRTDGLGSNNSLDVSLLGANINELGIETNSRKGLSIRNVLINGKILYTEGDTNTRVRIGGAMPHVSKESTLYQVQSNVDISALSSGSLFIGGVAGENDDLITTCNATGVINFQYTPNTQSKVGGIVGSNNRDGEVKNCISSNVITFDNSIVQDVSRSPLLYMGGIAGTNYGVMTYITSDAKINVNKAFECTIGGIAGYSEDGILSNILCRGEINCVNVPTLYVSEMVGVSKYGLFETAIITTKINVDNATINSKVYLGMVTMFEDLDLAIVDFMNDNIYNAEYSPHFSGILVGSKNTIYMKPLEGFTLDNLFIYNLGLRNEFEFLETDPDTGETKGEWIEGEDGSSTFVPETGTRIPDVYNKLFYTTGYSIEKYTISKDKEGKDIKSQDILKLTYAKDSQSNASIVSECSDSRLSNVNSFVRDFGFKYGLNHSEIDLSNLSLDKIKFTLAESEHHCKYFEKLSYNGDLAYFDRYIDGKCTYDSNDEMFSLINSLVLSNVSPQFVPLKISRAFASTILTSSNDPSEDIPSDDNSGGGTSSGGNSGEDNLFDDNYDSSINLAQNFALNIQKIIYNMIGVEPEIMQLTDDKNVVGDENYDVKYMLLTFSDVDYRYFFTFDVSKMMMDENMLEDSYIVYLQYQRGNKY